MTPIEMVSVASLFSALAILIFLMVRDYSHKRGLLAAEYRRARVVISDIVVEMNRRISEARDASEQNREEISNLVARIMELERGIFNIRETINEKINTKPLEEKLNNIADEINKIRERLIELERSIHIPRYRFQEPPVQPQPIVIKRRDETQTDTGKRILEILERGPMDYKEIRRITGLSREHISRELKKLCDQGYLMRDESKRPYTYWIKR